jgi:hypothetical protein
MGIHLFRYTHGGERIVSHDVVRDAFASITKDVRFHVLREQTHNLSTPSFQFSCRQVNIVCKVDDICTLVDVIIVGIIQANLLSQMIFSRGLAASLVAQVKERFYYNH